MNLMSVIELEAPSVRFYSANDESAFFEWLEKIECVESCEGRGVVIYLSVNSGAITENCLRELLSLFRRYEIPMRQLAVFDRNEFSTWFRDPRAYWHQAVFKD